MTLRLVFSLYFYCFFNCLKNIVILATRTTKFLIIFPYKIVKSFVKYFESLSPLVFLAIFTLFIYVTIQILRHIFNSYTDHHFKKKLYIFIIIILVFMLRTLIRNLQAIYYYYSHRNKTMRSTIDKQQQQTHDCICTKIIGNNFEFLKNQTSSIIQCLHCDISFVKPIKSDGSGLDVGELQLHVMDKHRSVLKDHFLQLEAMQVEYTEKIGNFSLFQADHFENIRREIDIARETFIQEIFSNNNGDEKKLDDIQKQSADLIKQVEFTEQAFRLNFNEELKKNEDSLLKIESEDVNELNLEKIQSLKASLISKLEMVQKNINRFKLFEYDLVRNKFDNSTNNDENKHLTFGQLYLFNNFLTENSQHVITCSKDNYGILIWDVNSSSLISKRFSQVTCFILDETTKIFCGYKSGDIKIWDITTNKELAHLKSHYPFTYSISCLKLLESNQNYLAAGSSDCKIQIWDFLTSECLHILNRGSSDSWIACLAELPSGYLISGSGSFDGRIRVWDLKNYNLIHNLRDFQKEHCYWNQIYCIKVLPQSHDFFVSGSSDDAIKIWNAKLGRCVKYLNGHTNAVTDLDFNLSNQLISCSKDGTIRIWEIKNLLLNTKCIRVLRCGFDNPHISCIRYNKTNGKLLSGSRRAIRVWNMDTGECEKTIPTEYSITNMELCICY